MYLYMYKYKYIICIFIFRSDTKRPELNQMISYYGRTTGNSLRPTNKTPTLLLPYPSSNHHPPLPVIEICLEMWVV